MKRIIFCLLVLALCTLSLTPPARAGATTQTLHFSQTATQLMANPCNGEPVLLTIEATRVVHRTTTPNGNIHIHSTSNLHGDGVGLTTGVNYVLNSVATANFNNNGGGATNQTLWQDAVAVAQGNVPNFLFQQTEHFTVNANGDITVNFDKSFVKCQG
jgi:hypothetical protein